MNAILAKFDSQTLHSTLAILAVYVGLMEAHIVLPTAIVVAAIAAIGFKEGLGKLTPQSK